MGNSGKQKNEKNISVKLSESIKVFANDRRVLGGEDGIQRNAKWHRDSANVQERERKIVVSIAH